MWPVFLALASARDWSFDPVTGSLSEATLSARPTQCQPRQVEPSGWRFDGMEIVVDDDAGHEDYRRPVLPRLHDLVWVVEVDGIIVIGAGRPPEPGGLPFADRTVAIEKRSGRTLWTRTNLRSLYGTDLEGPYVLVDGMTSLSVLDVHTGESVGTATTGTLMRTVCRCPGGLDWVTTQETLHAIEPASGRIRWSMRADVYGLASVDRWVVTAVLSGVAVELVAFDLTTGEEGRRTPLGGFVPQGDRWGVDLSVEPSGAIGAHPWWWVE